MRDIKLKDFFWFAYGEQQNFHWPTKMPGRDPRPLGELLEEYELFLSKTLPSEASGLRPGLSDDAITVLEKKYEIKIPVDIAIIYKWHNGESYRDRPGELKAFPLGTFVPLEESPERRRLFECKKLSIAMELKELDSQLTENMGFWIGLFVDPASDGLYVDLSRSSNDGNLIDKSDTDHWFYPSISNRIAMLVDAANAGFLECSEFGISFSGDLLDRDKFIAFQSRYAAYQF